MAVTLNRRAFEHAKELINERSFVFDERDARCEHQPSAQRQNEFIHRHGFAEYGKWHLGINDENSDDTKGHYEFPYGDVKDVHRCGLLAAESRAGQYKHFDIENAAAHLHGMLDARKVASPKRSRAASAGRQRAGPGIRRDDPIAFSAVYDPKHQQPAQEQAHRQRKIKGYVLQSPNRYATKHFRATRHPMKPRAELFMIAFGI
jgi:hypothetical protein